MQKDIQNKAILEPEAHDVETKAEVAALDSWQFSGDGRKAPVTIQAVTVEEAKAKYEKYLND